MLKQSVQKVQDALVAKGLNCEVKQYPASTRTAQDAAQAIGCDVAAIVKSLIFKTKESTPQAILVLASGVNLVDLKKLKSFIGCKCEKADADFVRKHTGFAIGGVPPIGHTTPIKTLIDRDLLQIPELWAAAGTPNTVFSLPSEAITSLTHGEVIDIK